MWHALLPALLLLSGRSSATNLLETVIELLQESDHQLSVQQREEPVEAEYDWVIVGAGTAGCVLASRLTEVAEWSVLLLEAGGREEFYTDIPVITVKNQRTDLDWAYRSEPSSEYARGYVDGRNYLPRGKVLGGSSVLNYMLATRGNRRDYDHWQALGNPGWGYDHVLPYFIKAENMTIPGLRGSPLHGTGGPLTISHSSYRTELARAFLQAGRELGHHVGDYNGKTQNQFSYFQFNKKNGRRVSSPRGYIYPILQQRKNLHIRLKTQVTKIIVEGDTAQGVVFEWNGVAQEVRARKEVILSAGAMNSPQVLMLSGIGPREHLESLNIPVLQDLPVGRNLQDHVSFSGLLFLTNLTDRSLNATCIANDPQHLVDYVRDGFGPYEIPGGNECVFFYDINDPNAENGYPDIEMHFSSVAPFPEEKVRGFTPRVYNTMFRPYEKIVTWALQPILMHPKSRGVITLRSRDPFEKVKIEPNYLHHPDDVKTILRGVHKTLEISRTRAFQRFGSRLSPSVMPGCEQLRFGSDEYWTCCMRTTTISNYHQVGTCAMTPDGVVDARLRVHGIKRLRVIDSSIMPTVPSAHTNVPTTMIAEKGAAIIKEDYNQS